MTALHKIFVVLGILFFVANVISSNVRPEAEERSEIEKRLNDSPRHQEWVTIETPHGTKLEAFIVFPEAKTAAASVIVIHENRGLTDWVRSVADRLAEEGYVALTPDLLSGKGPNKGGSSSFASEDDLRKALSQLTSEETTGNLKSAVKYLRDLPSTNDKVAVAGFCWGGSNTFRFATNEPSLSAAFVFYGGPPDNEALKRISCPIYGFYGENDNRVTSTVEPTQKIMAELNKKYEPVIYPGGMHGFMRAGEEPNATQANKDARTKGWERFLELLKKM